MSNLGFALPSRPRSGLIRLAALAVAASLTAIGGPTTAATPPPSGARAPIEDGTYRTRPLTRRDLLEAIRRHALPPDPRLDKVVPELVTYTMRFADGLWTQSQDTGSGDEPGAHATFSFPDDHTLHLVAADGGTFAEDFDITQVPGGFALTIRDDGVYPPFDRPVVVEIFETAPYLLVSAASSSPSADPSPAPLPSGPGAQFQSQAFRVPLTITLDPTLAVDPDPDSHELLSWNAAASDDEKIRFLSPEVVLPPGTSELAPPPADMAAYLLGQAANGAVFTDRAEITVGGRPATIFTATTPTPLGDSIGCALMPDQSEACYGFLPDFLLRMAVIDLGDGTPLVTWARTPADHPDLEFLARFEQMLGTVHFDTDRLPAPTPSPTPRASLTGLLPEGRYSTPPLTADQIRAAISAAGYDPSQWVTTGTSFEWTIEFKDGRLLASSTEDGVPQGIGWNGTYRLLDDHTIEARDAISVITYDFSLDGDVLTMRLLTDSLPEPGELAAQAALYDTSPFTREGGGPVIADGTYSTGPLPVAVVRAALERHDMTERAKQAGFLEGAGTVEYLLRFDGGVLTLLYAVDGAPPNIGTFGHYTFLDDHHVRYVDSDGSVHVYTFEVTGDSFTATVDPADLPPAPDPIGPLWNVAQWESAPHTLVPSAAPSAVAAGFPDGTYRADITPDEMRASWVRFAVPEDQHEVCPCHPSFTLAARILSGGETDRWPYRFDGDRLILPTDGVSFRWSFDGGRLAFSDMEGGWPGAAALFMTTPFDWTQPTP